MREHVLRDIMVVFGGQNRTFSPVLGHPRISLRIVIKCPEDIANDRCTATWFMEMGAKH